MASTVSIVEDDIYFIEILKEIISMDDTLLLKAIYSDCQSALQGYENSPTDIFLIDLQLPDASGMKLITTFKETHPNTMFIICTSSVEEDKIFDALKVGANGYLLKTEPFQIITTAIHEALDGGAPMSKAVAKKVVAHFYKASTLGMDILTAKENELLALLSEGYLYKEIANRLHISIDTVKKHTGSIYRKLHVSNKTEAINLFLDR